MVPNSPRSIVSPHPVLTARRMRREILHAVMWVSNIQASLLVQREPLRTGRHTIRLRESNLPGERPMG